MDCLYLKKNIKGNKSNSPYSIKFDGAWNPNEVFYAEEDANPAVDIAEPIAEPQVNVGDGLMAQLEAQVEPRRVQPLTWQDVRDILDRYNNAYVRAADQGANQYAWYQI